MFRIQRSVALLATLSQQNLAVLIRNTATPIPTAAEIEKKYNETDASIEGLFETGCMMYHKQDITMQVQTQLGKGNITSAEVPSATRAIENTRISAMQSSCGKLEIYSMMSCRQHCVDVYTSSKDGVAIRETKEACIQSCQDNVDQFKDSCAVEVSHLKTAYAQRAKTNSDTDACYEAHCRGFPAAQAARTEATVNGNVTSACTSRCTNSTVANCKKTCEGSCDATKMLACVKPLETNADGSVKEDPAAGFCKSLFKMIVGSSQFDHETLFKNLMPIAF
eukprot:TRINITY_DN59817_c0_g1_i1.p1 TRINITY_DN59817_c0_g1~~TRINITY_DN59817_c0_g1_i1.p1  ORF type:complete len:279 (+),score=57.00 TRINITY_DN59817_c0_g1_i1:73-909(+)